MKARPIDKDGNLGPAQEIDDIQFKLMRRHYGKKLRWEPIEKTVNLRKLTKSELINRFNLPDNDMGMLKSEIIKKIQDGQ